MGGLEEDLTPWAGGFERINAYAFFAWLVVLAVTMLRRSLGQVTPEKGVAETEVVQTSEPSLVARVDEETSTRPEAGDRGWLHTWSPISSDVAHPGWREETKPIA